MRASLKSREEAESRQRSECKRAREALVQGLWWEGSRCPSGAGRMESLQRKRRWEIEKSLERFKESIHRAFLVA